MALIHVCALYQYSFHICYDVLGHLRYFLLLSVLMRVNSETCSTMEIHLVNIYINIHTYIYTPDIFKCWLGIIMFLKDKVIWHLWIFLQLVKKFFQSMFIIWNSLGVIQIILTPWSVFPTNVINLFKSMKNKICNDF